MNDKEGVCIYCSHAVPIGDVPDVFDDEAWEEEAEHHDDDCEWVKTRAHRIAYIPPLSSRPR